MSTKIDKGHVPNVANFKELIQRVGAIPTYNPAKAALQITSLNALHAQAETSLDATATAYAYWKDKIKERRACFDQMGLLAVRVAAAIKASDVREEIVNESKSIVRRIRGARVKDPTPATTTDTPTDSSEYENPARRISASQRSFDQQAKNFDALIKLAKTQVAYMPNEPELTILGLETFYAQLLQVNKDVSGYATGVFTQRFERNKLLYAPKTGICQVAQAVKDYVKSLLGTQDSRYKALRKIRFSSVKS